MRAFPFTHPVGQLSTEMDRLFDTIVRQSLPQSPRLPRGSAATMPALNVWEDDQNLFIEAEVPGMALENIELLIQNDELTLRGRREPMQQEGITTLRRERWSGQFERTIGLPTSVDQENAQAALHNGILTITLPKAASVRPRKIEIRTLQGGKQS
jgi:HSP20 family protein